MIVHIIGSTALISVPSANIVYLAAVICNIVGICGSSCASPGTAGINRTGWIDVTPAYIMDLTFIYIDVVGTANIYSGGRTLNLKSF